MAYNKLILYQEGTLCFKISEEIKIEKVYNGETRRAWDKISRKIDPTIGDCNKIQNIFKERTWRHNKIPKIWYTRAWID